MLYVLLAIALVPLLLLNLLGPLIIWKSQRLPARPELQEYQPDNFLAERESQFCEWHRELGQLGYQVATTASLEDTQVSSHIAVYSHPDDSSCATLACLESIKGNLVYLEFSQLHADNSILDVSNSPQVSAYPRLPHKRTLRFPKVITAAELHRIFIDLRSHLSNSSVPVPPQPDRLLEQVIEHFGIESDALVKRGICHPDIDTDGKRSLTLKGAYMLTWASVFPGKPLKDRLDQYLSCRLLERARRT